MKLGFGLYYPMLQESCIEQNLAFAKQCGATDVIVHLVNYFYQGTQESLNQPIGGHDGWGVAGSNPEVWELDYLQTLKNRIESNGLTWYGVENFDPIDWYGILLGQPIRKQQIKKLKKIIRYLGSLGICCMGYNFSLAGVCARRKFHIRGGAMSVGMNGLPDIPPIPQGMVWNMIYDRELYARAKEKYIYQPKCEHNELWQRLTWFLYELIPVAEEAGVMLCAHPDDPPLESLRYQARLVYRPEMYQRLIDIQNSNSNGLELCLGTLQEMHSDGQDIFSYLESYLDQNKIGYIHLRNIIGKVPYYKEVFIDEGDLDVGRVVSILKQRNFQGVIIPDHAPKMSCDSPWYAGMAYAMGYLKALLA